MTLEDQGGIEGNPTAHGRPEVIEMHLFDEDATEARALCETDALSVYRRGVRGYLEDRLNDIGVGTISEGCKSLSIPFAAEIAQDREAEGLAHEAEEYRQLADMLRRETAS